MNHCLLPKSMLALLDPHNRSTSECSKTDTKDFEHFADLLNKFYESIKKSRKGNEKDLQEPIQLF